MTHFDDVPKKVRIGPHDYNIEIMPPERCKEEGHFRFGEIVWLEQRISVNPDIKSPSMAREVLMHEITHALINTICLQTRDDERVAQIMGVGLIQLIRDNPDLISWLTEKKNNGCACGGNCKCGPDNSSASVPG